VRRERRDGIECHRAGFERWRPPRPTFLYVLARLHDWRPRGGRRVRFLVSRTSPARPVGQVQCRRRRQQQ